MCLTLLMLFHHCCQPCANPTQSQILLLPGDGKILNEHYALLPVDLRDLGALQSLLQSAGFQPNVPTFVLAECVLVYMEPHESGALVKHLGQQLSSAVCVVYEQVASLQSSVLLFSRSGKHGRGSISVHSAHLCLLLCPAQACMYTTSPVVPNLPSVQADTWQFSTFRC